MAPAEPLETAMSDPRRSAKVAALCGALVITAGAEAMGSRAMRARVVDPIEIVGECLVADACIDQYLWALYVRTLKEDTIKVHERKKVAVKRKGKMVTVTRTVTRLVDQDFTWKDPKAAERAGMEMMDYVIGGMNRSFK